METGFKLIFAMTDTLVAFSKLFSNVYSFSQFFLLGFNHVSL